LFSAVIEGSLVGDKGSIGVKSKIKNCLVAPKMKVEDGENLQDEDILE